MKRTFLIWGALLGAIAVALGAFGAHGLKQIVDADTVGIFQTGVQYQMYHALALLATAMIYDRLANPWIMRAGYGFITGVVLFSGSLYALTALKAAGTTELKAAGIITPFGGVAFIAGWLFLLVGVLKNDSSQGKL